MKSSVLLLQCASSLTGLGLICEDVQEEMLCVCACVYVLVHVCVCFKQIWMNYMVPNLSLEA